MADFKGERKVNDLATKEVFNYVDESQKIECLSREIFKKRDEVIHYPFDVRNGSVKQKYEHIKRIRFVGVKGKIPVGLIKAPSKGYGFTRILSRLIYHVDETYELTEVVIEKHATTNLDTKGKRLTLSLTALSQLHTSFSSALDRQRGEIKTLIEENLYTLFKSQCPKPKAAYRSGTVAASLAGWGNSLKEFSDADRKAIYQLFEKLSLTPEFLSSSALAKTKVLIDCKYIQDALSEFRKLMAYATDTLKLEKKWQKFLKDNSWVFSSIFAQPVILHKDEAFVGGKNIDNKDGKLSDFLLKNALSDNVAFLEIKTHKTALLDRKAYRSSNVFSMTKELGGCITQVLNQRDTFQKEFYTLRGKSKAKLETLNSKCVVIIGSVSELSDEQKESFELIRNNSKDVEIITFDELRNKVEALQTLMKK